MKKYLSLFLKLVRRGHEYKLTPYYTHAFIGWGVLLTVLVPALAIAMCNAIIEGRESAEVFMGMAIVLVLAFLPLGYFGQKSQYEDLGHLLR